MNPANRQFIKGARLAFAQGGWGEFRLVHLTPPILEPQIVRRGVCEAIWRPAKMPFKYTKAPLLINNDGQSEFRRLKHFIAGVKRKTWAGKFASQFRTCCEPLKTQIAGEMIRVFNKRAKRIRSALLASKYCEALPCQPRCISAPSIVCKRKVERNRRRSYLRRKGRRCKT